MSPKGEREEAAAEKLPRGRWFGGKGPRSNEILRIGMVATLLVVIVVMGRPCAEGMSRFVESFAPPPDAGPPQPSLQVERLTPEEIERRFPSGNDAGAVAAPPPAAPGGATAP
ncbi:MAG TPA: hypothetical protein VMZ28_18870 [Kofleriaceae bacterium]|nr:hypothetical protein [Kofleriaceae bacterium]